MNSYWLDGPGFELPEGKEVFCSLNASELSLDQISLILNWYPGLFAGQRRTALEDGHSPSSKAETKKEWSYIQGDSKRWTHFKSLYWLEK